MKSFNNIQSGLLAGADAAKGDADGLEHNHEIISE